jgi:DnaJ-class molecular chaperone
MNNPIKILKLEPGDDLAKAHKKRNALFKKLHPDKNPSDKESYQRVYDAYESLKKNPNILRNNNRDIRDNGYIIRIKQVILIEDIYFKKYFTVSYCRKIFCLRCNGTGTFTGSIDLCPCCRGRGYIDNDIYHMLEKRDTCPVCKGIKVNINNICPACQGLKYSIETRTIRFAITIDDYHNRKKIIFGKGHQYGKSTYGRVLILLIVKPNNLVGIEDKYFVINDDILPVQSLIGDNKTVEIFGQKVEYKIEKNSKESYTIKKINPRLIRNIRIIHNIIKPPFTPETSRLYKKILELEKQNLANKLTKPPILLGYGEK